MDSMLLDDAIIYGTTTFCNTHLEGILTLGTSSNTPYAFSNIPDSNLSEIQGTLLVDDNLYVQGRIFCNGIQWSAMDSMLLDDAIIYGTTTFCNTHLEGILTLGTSSNTPYAFSNIPDSNLSEIQGTLLVDDNLYVQGRIFCNGIQWSAMDSMLLDDAIIYGTTTFCNTHLEGILTLGTSSNTPYAFSNIPDSNLSEIQGTLLVDDNLYVQGRIFCNGIQWSAMDSMLLDDAIIYGTTTFCNTHLEGILTIGASSTEFYAFSNIPDANLSEVQGALLVDENLYVQGRIFCNGIQWSAADSMEMHDAVVHGTLTLCNTNIKGLLTIGSSDEYMAFSNIPNSNINDVTGALNITEDLYVGGRIFCNGFSMTALNAFESTLETLTVSSNFTLSYQNNPKWRLQLENSGSDLVFKSVNNTTMVITDNFTSSILNFTGQHLATMKHFDANKVSLHDYIGKIVVSTGKYKNINNEEFIEIDDAIPVIELSHKPKDQRVFGVVSDIESQDKTRSYKIGNLQFVQDKSIDDIKIKVNAVGEGGIWVCNMNGNLRNGDFITTCQIPGYGAKQKFKAVFNYTVAKITCDCSFELDSDTYYCEEFTHNNRTYRKAFVGCIYKC
jgi:hypothetical protein